MGAGLGSMSCGRLQSAALLLEMGWHIRSGESRVTAPLLMPSSNAGRMPLRHLCRCAGLWDDLIRSLNLLGMLVLYVVLVLSNLTLQQS